MFSRAIMRGSLKILIILIHVKETKKIQTKSQFLQEELAIKYQIISDSR